MAEGLPDYGVDMAQDPAARGVQPPAEPAPKAPLPGQTDVMGMFKDTQTRITDTEMQRRKEMEPAIEGLRSANSQPIPKAPTPGRVGPPPQQKFGEDMMGWMQSAMILGAIGGVIGRKHVTNALTAFSGAMEGFKEGNLQKAKLDMEHWKAETDRTIDNNKAMMDQYNAVLKSRQMDLDQKMNEVQLLATKWHDRAAYDAASSKNVTEFGKYLEQQRYHTEQLAIRRDAVWNQSQALRQKIDQYEAGKLPPATIESMAKQALTGDKSVFQNLGRGAQGAENVKAIREKMSELAPGMGITPERLSQINAEYQGQVSGQRNLGTTEARVTAVVEEAKKTFPLALQALEKVDRSTYVPYNKLKQMVERQTASPELAALHTATEAVLTAYSQAMSRGGQGNVHNRQRAESMLDTAMSPDAYKAVIAQMNKEMDAARTAPEAARKTLREGAGGEPAAAPPPPAAPTGPKEGDTATNKATGERLMFKGGSWQPM